MPLFKFRVYLEEDDQIYRDVEIKTSQSFYDLHLIILKAYDFDGKHAASFFESNDRWIRGREIHSNTLVNKKNAPNLSMVKTPVSALVSKPEQKFVYEYDPSRKWTFLVELIGISAREKESETYPRILRKEGIAPGQYGAKGVDLDKLLDVEEKYDLGADDMAEGYGQEGEAEADGPSGDLD